MNDSRTIGQLYTLALKYFLSPNIMRYGCPQITPRDPNSATPWCSIKKSWPVYRRNLLHIQAISTPISWLYIFIIRNIFTKNTNLYVDSCRRSIRTTGFCCSFSSFNNWTNDLLELLSDILQFYNLSKITIIIIKHQHCNIRSLIFQSQASILYLSDQWLRQQRPTSINIPASKYTANSRLSAFHQNSLQVSSI